MASSWRTFCASWSRLSRLEQTPLPKVHPPPAFLLSLTPQAASEPGAGVSALCVTSLLMLGTAGGGASRYRSFRSFSVAHESSHACAEDLLLRMQDSEATVVSDLVCMPIIAGQDVRPLAQ